jgi:PAS domain S-box-containing protein
MVQGVLYQNATGTLISANPAAQRLLGLSIDEMAGRGSADPRWKAVHEDGSAFPGDDHPPMRALRTGQPVLGVVMGIFNPRMKEMRWLRMDGVPQFRPGEDRPYQVYSTFEDITERKQAAEMIQVSEQRYRRLFETARDGILLLDSAESRITDANPFMLELLGYSHADMIGKQLWEIGLLQDKEASQEAFRQLRQENYIRYEDLPVRTQTGEHREVEFVSNLYRENGYTVIQCNIRDIADRKHVAAELAAVAENHSRHAAVMAVLEERTRLAHEIHDTLAQGFTGITTQLEAADAALAKALEPDAPDDLTTHQAQLEKVYLRIGKARDLARESLTEARRSVLALRSPALEAVSLSEALARFLTQKAPGTVPKSRYVLEGAPHPLPSDIEHCLLRIGQEAIANAVTHAHAQEIAVDLSFAPGQVRLRVSDDGQGFNPDLLVAGRFGVIGMQERAKEVRGKLSIISHPGEGTEIDLTVLVPKETNND